jgi:hypothetical protein
MKAYHFRKTVDVDGTIHLSDLPPYKEVEIVVLYPESSDWQAEFERWLADIRTRHPLARMSKADILNELRKTREDVWAERHAN